MTEIVLDLHTTEQIAALTAEGYRYFFGTWERVSPPTRTRPFWRGELAWLDEDTGTIRHTWAAGNTPKQSIRLAYQQKRMLVDPRWGGRISGHAYLYDAVIRRRAARLAEQVPQLVVA